MDRKTIFGGVSWTLVGYGTSLVIRFGGNLVLTRLLFPEAFGLMALVNAFQIAFQMFTDMGLVTAIIQSPRGDERPFLNTTWSLQIMRSILVTVLVCAVAYPASLFYKQPDLFPMLLVASLNSLILGLSSTKFSVLKRHLQLRRVVLVEMLCQAVGLATTVVLAWYHPSVWSLIYGGLVASTITLVASYFITSGPRDHWQLEPEAMSELIHFGKWIFLSTMLTFLTVHGDRLLLGKLFSLEQLAIYSIAYLIAQVGTQAMHELAARVLLPVYSRLLEQRSEEALRRIRKLRTIIIIAVLPLVCILAIWGDNLIELLYDPRYHGAGPMLRILAVGALASMMNASISPILLASGKSKSYMISMAIRTVLLFSCMMGGYYLGGVMGTVKGIAAAQFLEYPFLILLVKKHRVWQPKLDFTSMAVGILLVTAIP